MDKYSKEEAERLHEDARDFCLYELTPFLTGGTMPVENTDLKLHTTTGGFLTILANASSVLVYLINIVKSWLQDFTEQTDRAEAEFLLEGLRFSKMPLAEPFRQIAQERWPDLE